MENALELWLTPIQDLVLLMSARKSSMSSKLCRNTRSFFCSSSKRLGLGTMAIEIVTVDVYQRMTLVAKCV